MTNQFILSKVAPYGCEAHGEQAALSLGETVLWCAFEEKNPDDEFPVLPEWLRSEVLSSFHEEFYGCEEENLVCNPVFKVTIVPQGSGMVRFTCWRLEQTAVGIPSGNRRVVESLYLYLTPLIMYKQS